MKKPTLPSTPGLSTAEKSALIAALLDEKQAENIIVLDVSAICPISERLVLVTARGQRHAQSLADAVLDLAKQRKFASLGVEGYESGGWVLVDLNDVILHVFQEDSRRFYNLEGLWAEGKRVDAPTGVVRSDDLDDDFDKDGEGGAQ